MDVAHFCWGCATFEDGCVAPLAPHLALQEVDVALFSRLSRQVDVRRLGAAAAAQLASAFAKLQPPPPELFRDLGGYAARHCHVMEPQPLATLLWALMAVDLPQPLLADSLPPLCRTRLRTCGPEELAAVAEAYACFSGRDPEILQDLRLDRLHF